MIIDNINKQLSQNLPHNTELIAHFDPHFLPPLRYATEHTKVIYSKGSWASEELAWLVVQAAVLAVPRPAATAWAAAAADLVTSCWMWCAWVSTDQPPNKPLSPRRFNELSSIILSAALLRQRADPAGRWGRQQCRRWCQQQHRRNGRQQRQHAHRRRLHRGYSRTCDTSRRACQPWTGQPGARLDFGKRSASMLK